MTREIQYRQAVAEAIAEEMRRDPKVFLIGEDVGKYGGAFGATKGLLDEFGPQRVRDTPISEAAIVGLAIGAALTGMRPIAEIMYVDFLMLAMEQLVNQAAKVRYMFGGAYQVPLVLRTQCGAGRSSAAQHSQSLEALFVHIPGLKVVMPATPYDAKGLLKSAARDNNVVVFIEHKLLYAMTGPVPQEEYLIPLGQAEVKRPGKHVTVVAYSRMVHFALDAAKELASQGIECEVIDLRTLKPLDLATVVNSVKRTGRLVIVHEAPRTGGFGAELLARVSEAAFDSLDAPIQRVAGADVPIPYSPPLEAAAIPSPACIVAAVRAIA